MNATSTLRVIVEPGGDQVVGHVGLHALGSFADRLHLGESLGAAVPIAGERAPAHDRGKVLVQAMLMLAGGGESCADIEHLRAQPDLFGSVASDSTLYRVICDLSPDVLEELRAATAPVRAEVWQRLGLIDKHAPIVLDIDSSLIEIHSEHKEGTAPHYKGGFGFHPLFCFADETGECLSERLRPGNATANNVADQLGVIDEALAQLPVTKRQVVVRADSAGCTNGFVFGLRERKVSFAVIARKNAQIYEAIWKMIADGRWRPAVRQDGERRPGAEVAELTDLVDLSGFPEGTRLIVRREPLHEGAQQRLFPSDAYRYWGFYTDCEGDVVELDRFMRAHAHVEDHIKRLKVCGAERFPFAALKANRAWLWLVVIAADLVRYFQLLCLPGRLASAEPKALRWQVFHAPGRLVRHGRRRIVRILSGWPAEAELLGAYRRMALLT